MSTNTRSANPASITNIYANYKEKIVYDTFTVDENLVTKYRRELVEYLETYFTGSRTRMVIDESRDSFRDVAQDYSRAVESE